MWYHFYNLTLATAQGLNLDLSAHLLALGTWDHWTETLLTLRQRHDIINPRLKVTLSNRTSVLDYCLRNNFMYKPPQLLPADPYKKCIIFLSCIKHY